MTESQHQQALFGWRDIAVKKCPELALLYAIPNQGRRDRMTGARMKAEGLKAGVSDIHLPIPKGKYVGLWIEMKSPKGRLTESQAEWARLVQEHGHCFKICRSWDEARDVLLMYLDSEDS